MRKLWTALLARLRGRRRHSVDMDAARRGVEAHRSQYGAYEALGQDHRGPS